MKVVNELDRCSRDAQDLLLTYLDRMPAGHAFLGTTNLDIGNLTERFQTRFQSIRLQPPANEVLAQYLARRWGAPISITRKVADGAKGNVQGGYGGFGGVDGVIGLDMQRLIFTSPQDDRITDYRE